MNKRADAVKVVNHVIYCVCLRCFVSEGEVESNPVFTMRLMAHHPGKYVKFLGDPKYLNDCRG